MNVTAALLTVIGYSVNDTIVVFDRVRENMKAMRGESLATVVNLSVNQTLSRTFITAGTTLLSVLSLYLFGGEALRGFAFTMLVGIVSGTYSTVFIASAIATMLSGRVQPVRAAARRAPQPLYNTNWLCNNMVMQADGQPSRCHLRGARRSDAARHPRPPGVGRGHGERARGTV